jgi:hypothetical protein
LEGRIAICKKPRLFNLGMGDVRVGNVVDEVELLMESSPGVIDRKVGPSLLA